MTERLTRERGWELATSPADADLLVVCGTAGITIGDAVERVWSQLPSPRARADIRHPGHVADELDRARARLGDSKHQRADLTGRASAQPRVGAAHGDTDADEHSGRDEPEDAHAAASDGDADQQSTHDDGGDPGDDNAAPVAAHQGGHGPHVGGHDMGGSHEMGGGYDMHMMHGGEVAGLPMADRAPDRDGLTLDALHVTLGPILADWPAGLVMRVILQGDVVQSAQMEVVGEEVQRSAPWEAPSAVVALDSLARLFSVCGWPSATRTARRLRDDLLAGILADTELRRFTRRLRRSRTLRWATDGIGCLEDTHGDLAGDATQRWRRWVDAVEGIGTAADTDRGPADRVRVVLEELPGLLAGQELAAARVLVASFDPDLDSLVATRGTGAAR